MNLELNVGYKLKTFPLKLKRKGLTHKLDGYFLLKTLS